MPVNGIAVWHIVQFAASATPEPIAAAHDALVAARGAGELDYGYLALGQTVERAVRDGLFAGPIHIATPASHQTLIAGFGSVAALDAYYSAPAHARIRRELFSALSPRAAALYARIDAEPAQAAHHYLAIESAVRRIISRTDIVLGSPASAA